MQRLKLLLSFFLFGDKWGSGIRTHTFNKPTNLDFPNPFQALCFWGSPSFKSLSSLGASEYD